MKTTVLLIDSDLGFAFWLARILDQAGYEAYPARSVNDALTLIATLHLSVSLVIMNLSLSGGAEFLNECLRTQSSARLIGLSDSAPLASRPEPYSHYQKPEPPNEWSAGEFLRLIYRVLTTPPVQEDGVEERKGLDGAAAGKTIVQLNRLTPRDTAEAHVKWRLPLRLD